MKESSVVCFVSKNERLTKANGFVFLSLSPFKVSYQSVKQRKLAKTCLSLCFLIVVLLHLNLVSSLMYFIFGIFVMPSGRRNEHY